jgi:hypothetical protein
MSFPPSSSTLSLAGLQALILCQRENTVRFANCTFLKGFPTFFVLIVMFISLCLFYRILAYSFELELVNMVHILGQLTTLLLFSYDRVFKKSK